ncbi:MAG: peptidylprolyl isomerase [Clostridium sp.]
MSKIIAKVNGREITQTDLDVLLGGLQPQVAAQFYSQEGQARLLDELINQELLYSDAVSSNYEAEAEFIAEMKQVKANVLKQYALRKVLNDVKVADADVENYYNENKDMYVQPEMAKASHILVDNEEKASELLAKIREGASFEELAEENSSCPSSQSGGDLGEFARGSMVPEFEEMAFSMNVGDVSEPVKTQFGYHLIKLVDKKTSTAKSFEEVKDAVANQLLGMKQQEAYMAKTTELKAKADIEIIK